MKCRNCGEAVRAAEPRDGLGPDDVPGPTDGLEWVHDFGPESYGMRGNPFCDMNLTAEPCAGEP